MDKVKRFYFIKLRAESGEKFLKQTIEEAMNIIRQSEEEEGLAA